MWAAVQNLHYKQEASESWYKKVLQETMYMLPGVRLNHLLQLSLHVCLHELVIAAWAWIDVCMPGEFCTGINHEFSCDDGDTCR